MNDDVSHETKQTVKLDPWDHRMCIPGEPCKAGQEITTSPDMIALRHVAAGWRIKTDPSIFGGIQQLTIGHNGVVQVIHDVKGVATLDPNEITSGHE